MLIWLPPGGRLWEINKPLLTQSNKMQVLLCCFLVVRVIVIRASSATTRSEHKSNSLFCWAVSSTVPWKMCVQRWMNWRKVNLCCSHDARAAALSWGGTCLVLCSTNPSSSASYTSLFPPATALPLPQRTFWFTPTPLSVHPLVALPQHFSPW